MPILCIGKHAYCDSRIILRELQARYPLKYQKSGSLADKGIEKLFQHWSIDGGLFRRAVSLLPVERSRSAFSPAFMADRSEMMGAPFTTELLIKSRPESTSYIRAAFDLLESTFLADGRPWILDGEQGPTAADIEAVYVFRWLIYDLKSLRKENVSESMFPKTFAWVRRFDQAVSDASIVSPKPTTLSGNDAVRKILESPDGAKHSIVDKADPLGLKVGQPVEVWPTDSGSKHHDIGSLVSLSVDEVCIRNSKGVFVHFPRWNFRIVPAREPKPPKTSAISVIPLKLLYHPMSPFARKVYMLAREIGLEQRIELKTVVVAPVFYPGWSDNNADVAVYNPLAKIPTLVVGDGDNDGIYDSRMICDFLETEAHTRPSSNWRLRTLHACADGILDALNLIIYEKKIRAENNVKFEPWITGQMEKIMRSFDVLERQVGRGILKKPVTGVRADVSEVAVAAAVGYIDINQIEWRGERPQLGEWMDMWQQRDSFVKTRPDIDWKTGEAADIGFARDALAGARSSKL